jgi:hypothetical protein
MRHPAKKRKAQEQQTIELKRSIDELQLAYFAVRDFREARPNVR